MESAPPACPVAAVPANATAAPPSVFGGPQCIGEKLAPFNPTHVEAVETALDLLQLTQWDKVYDLGCGDARFLIQAHHRCAGVRGLGVEYDAAVFARARANIDSLGQPHNIALVHGNALDIDFSDATALFVYLVPEGLPSQLVRSSPTLAHSLPPNHYHYHYHFSGRLSAHVPQAGMKKLAERLRAAVERGARVVTYVFSVPGLRPSETVLFKGATKIYLYKV